MNEESATRTGTAVRPTVIYDGSCAFCRGQVARLQAWDTDSQFTYKARQDADTETLFPPVGEIDLEAGLLLVMPDEHVHIGSEAIYQIASRLPQTRWLSWLYLLPGCQQIAKALYQWIIKNRYKLSARCSPGQCKPL